MRVLAGSLECCQVSVILLPTGLSGQVAAQAGQGTDSADQWIEEVHVIGTRINRRDYASPSPVLPFLVEK